MTSGESMPDAWTSSRSVVRSRKAARTSRKTVLIALAANTFVAVTKLAGGLIPRLRPAGMRRGLPWYGDKSPG